MCFFIDKYIKVYKRERRGHIVAPSFLLCSAYKAKEGVFYSTTFLPL